MIDRWSDLCMDSTTRLGPQYGCGSHLRYDEDMSDAKGGSKLIGSNQYVTGKAPRPYFRGGQSRPPPYGNRFTLRGNTSVNSVSQASSTNHGNRGRTQGNSYRGSGSFRGSRGRNTSQRTPPSSMQAPPNGSCWGCGGPHFQRECPKGQASSRQQERKASRSNIDNTHRIHAAVHNHQAEHQSTVVESSGKVNSVNLKILFDPGATDSFISPYALDKCGLASCEHDDFELVKMVSRVKQAVGLKVRGCQVDLGVCTTKLDAYVTNLGTYDLIVSMDWLDGHRDFMDFYAKKLLFLNDEG